MTMIAVRRVAGAATLAVLLYLVQLALFAPGARADHIPDTGPVPGNCVEFQVETTGPKSPPDYPGVTIDVTAWDADLKGFDFTISGLAAGQYVDMSVKSGQEIDEPGGFGNGPDSWSHTRQFAISHIRACVFEDTSEETTTSLGEETTTTAKDEETTTTAKDEETTSTTVEETTTTSGATSTSALQFTTSTLGSTTTTAEDPSTTVAEQTTTSEDDEEGISETTDADGSATGTLPFTGPTGGAMAGLGALALFTGAVLLFVANAKLESAPAVDRPRWSRC